MSRLLTILFVGLICEAIGVVLLSRGLKEIGWFFTGRDLRDLNSLAKRLTSPSDPISQFISDRLLPEERNRLQGTFLPAQRPEQTLVKALNRLLLGPSLYDAQPYAAVRLSPATHAQLEKSKEGNHVLELNRLLLQDAFPRELRKQGSEKTSPSEVLALVGRGIRNAHILLGVFFEALFFIGLLMLMTKADVSFVWPLTSLSFVVTTVAAKVYLHEDVSGLRWSGVCLIMMGAALITWTEKRDQAAAGNSALSQPAAGQPSASE